MHLWIVFLSEIVVSHDQIQNGIISILTMIRAAGGK